MAGDIVVTVRTAFSPIVVGADPERWVGRRRVLVRNMQGAVIGVRVIEEGRSLRIPVAKGAAVYLQIEGVAGGLWVRDGEGVSVSLR